MATNSEILDQALLEAVGRLSLDRSISLLTEQFLDANCSTMSRPQLISHLLALGADPNAVCDGSGQLDGNIESALYKAAILPDAESVEVLISAGADPGYRCPEYGWTPLQAAASCGNHCVFRPLVEGGADLEAGCNESGSTPLSIAAVSASMAVLVLLELGADANPAGDSPFDLAFDGGEVDASLAHGLLGLARTCSRATILELISWGTLNGLSGDADFSKDPVQVALATDLDSRLTCLLVEIGKEMNSKFGIGDIRLWMESKNVNG